MIKNAYIVFRQLLAQYAGIQLLRPGVRNVAIVVTDGRSNLDSDLTIPTANTLRNAGIDIFVVGQFSKYNLPSILQGSGTSKRVVQVREGYK